MVILDIYVANEQRLHTIIEIGNKHFKKKKVKQKMVKLKISYYTLYRI